LPQTTYSFHLTFTLLQLNLNDNKPLHPVCTESHYFTVTNSEITNVCVKDRSMEMSPYILNCGVAQTFVWKETILDEDKCKIPLTA
jgi:hypothetical protein